MSTDNSAVPRRRSSVILTLIAAMLAALAIQLVSAGTASAAIGDWKLGTYNMQGSTGGANGQSKWQSDVIPLMQGGVQVLALQEAGTIPASATVESHRTLTVWAPNGVHYNYDLTIATWNPGGRRGATYYIYLLNTDPNGHRVNIAFISTRRADDQLAAYGSAGGAGRPALGLRFGNELFWSVHALSNGGSNAAALVESINSQSGARAWAAMGDWNRTPDNFENQLFNLNRQLADNVTTYRLQGQGTDVQTQASGNQLDYMVSNQDDDSVGAYRMPLLRSDHWPVVFFQLRAQSRVGLINTANDRFLGLGEQSGRNGAAIDTDQTHEDAFGGQWYFDSVGTDSVGHARYRVRNISTQSCLYLPHPNSIAVQEPCDGSLGQMFLVKHPGGRATDPMILLQSLVDTTKCVGEISQGGIDGVPVVLTGCRTSGSYWYWRHDFPPDDSVPLLQFAN